MGKGSVVGFGPANEHEHQHEVGCVFEAGEKHGVSGVRRVLGQLIPMEFLDPTGAKRQVQVWVTP